MEYLLRPHDEFMIIVTKIVNIFWYTKHFIMLSGRELLDLIAKYYLESDRIQMRVKPWRAI
jgi:hypothetical protein